MTSNPSIQHTITGSAYGFSATRIEDLGAAEYTLVAITADVSGSVSDFSDEIEACILEVVRACRHSPRADNLMLRTTAFDDEVEEIHGFRPLAACQASDYQGRLRSGGTTALYDAGHNAVEAVARYGKDLRDHSFDVNAIVFVITDGMDNASSQTAASLKKTLRRAVREEHLESLIPILVGVNVTDPTVSQYLADLHKRAGFTQYVEIEQANAETLARLADFLSRSICAQSLALGTGGASQSLTF